VFVGGDDLRSTINNLGAERAELDAVLASRILGRANYLVRFLNFVCDKYFEGETDDIKEYSIAVQALGRSPDFDPQADTIVRVTAHALRKRLEEYYRTEGAEHAIQICLPAGHYVPNFIRRHELLPEQNGTSSTHAFALAGGEAATEPQQSLSKTPSLNGSYTAPLPGKLKPGSDAINSKQIIGVTVSLVLVVCVLLACGYYWTHRSGNGPISQAQAAAPIKASPVVRTMLGDNRKPYTDLSGFVWDTDRFCSGGDSFSVAQPSIQGTNDTELFKGGRHGVFHCSFPVTPGVYEVHLLFAETAGLQENARTVGFSLNGGPTNSLDVVDDAGSNNSATTKVFTDIEPTSDGNIHLDFTAPDSFLNAVEILPGIAHRPLPVRILAGRNAPYRDSSGNLWLPDQSFFGGRPSQVGIPLANLLDRGIYDGQRIGHFHYAVSVPAGRQYTLKLHFIERWFGIQNQNVGGIGSRIFDVSCNGTLLLKNFDIMREAVGTPLVKVFPHIDPTPQGKIEIYFTPAVNYPSISAVEVIPE
jgi:Malectin domain